MSTGREVKLELECGVLIDGGGVVNGRIGNERECEGISKNSVKS